MIHSTEVRIPTQNVQYQAADTYLLSQISITLIHYFSVDGMLAK